MSYDYEVGEGSEVGNWAANEKGFESLSLDLNRSLSHITQMSKMKKKKKGFTSAKICQIY